jgi:hypothetical protein
MNISSEKNVDQTRFAQLVRHIRVHGYQGNFYQNIITYYDWSGWVYWTMGAPIEETIIINRCKKENTYQYRLEHGSLPD